MRRYNPEDLPELNRWYASRKLPHIDSDSLPLIGFIEPDVAAGFLYLTDSSLGIIEGVVANPRASRESKDRALDEIDGRITQAARELGIKHLVAICASQALLRRSEHLGYIEGAPATILTKRL